MYEVNINATVDEFLQWDDILDEQPERVMQMLQSTDWWEFADEGAWNRAGARGENAIGGDLVRWLEDDGPEFAAEQLRKAGIKGIRYKDGFSRGKDGVATYNYVVFDENIIEIAKKYGISVMAAGYLSALYMQKGGQNDDNET